MSDVVTDLIGAVRFVEAHRCRVVSEGGKISIELFDPEGAFVEQEEGTSFTYAVHALRLKLAENDIVA